jgi:toxin YoeB
MSTQREALCHSEFLEDLQHWIEADQRHAKQNPRRTARRLLELMKAVMRDPFSGIGKPEPL